MPARAFVLQGAEDAQAGASVGGVAEALLFGADGGAGFFADGAVGGAEDLPRIVRIVRESGALDGAHQAAAAQAERARGALAALPANEYSRSLLELAAQLLQRRS